MTHGWDSGRDLSMRERLDSGERSFSFEFFPPKDAAGEEQLWQAITDLEPYGPTFVSVTYGAGGTTRDRTVAITERIARETSMLPVAHLTCVGHTTDEIASVLRADGRLGPDLTRVGARQSIAAGLLPGLTKSRSTMVCGAPSRRSLTPFFNWLTL